MYDEYIPGFNSWLPVVPGLFDHVQSRMESWGKEGQVDPFVVVYEVSHIGAEFVVNYFVNGSFPASL